MKVEIGEGLTINLNMAEQLDAPFLGGKSTSGTARAKVLGKTSCRELRKWTKPESYNDLYQEKG